MSKIGKIYNENRNGIIVTLLFHIILFSILNFTQFKHKKEYVEPEIIIDFPAELLQQVPEPEPQQEIMNNTIGGSRTNVAANRALNNQNSPFDENYQQELEQAQQLVKDVSNQLSKEIPTVDDLQMPEDVNDENSDEDILKKIYSGDSNIEYFLENRFHVRLPIPVYLAQNGGKVKVNIVVNSRGKVIKADPVVEPGLTDQMLSYAKTAALRTKFNRDPANQNQIGYIIYTFIAQ